MERLTTISASSVLVFAIVCITGCDAKSGKSEEQSILEIKSLGQLHITDPSEFLKRNFHTDSKVYTGHLSLKTDSLDTPSVVEFERNGSSVSLECELVIVTYAAGNTYLNFNSRPMSIENAIAMSQQLCDLVQVKSNKIMDWVLSNQVNDPLNTNCTASGNFAGQHHSVSIRRSFEGQKPWRVLYEIGYESQKGKALPGSDSGFGVQP